MPICVNPRIMADGQIGVSLSYGAYYAVGMDDPVRYPDLRRWANRGTYLYVSGTREALIQLATELNDRANEGSDGFNETAETKAVCRRAVASLRRQGITPRT